MESKALGKMCSKTVDVIYKVFTRQYYFVKILLSIKGHIYLIVWKKRRLLGVERMPYTKRSSTFRRTFSNGTATNMDFWEENIFSAQS